MLIQKSIETILLTVGQVLGGRVRGGLCVGCLGGEWGSCPPLESGPARGSRARLALASCQLLPFSSQKQSFILDIARLSPATISAQN